MRGNFRAGLRVIWARLPPAAAQTVKVILLLQLALIACLVIEGAVLSAWIVTGDSTYDKAWKVIFYVNWGVISIMSGVVARAWVKNRQRRM